MPAPACPGHLPATDRAWVADWNDFNAVHFSIPVERLAPHVPYELESYDGRAWVSLVWFELRRMRFAGTGTIGRLLCRPVSDHPFLNVRTYVRGANGPGICFLAEWIPNRLNCALGPLLYGLPYRYGRFTTSRSELNGTDALRIDDPLFHRSLAVRLPRRRTRDKAAPCAAGSVDEFLLERYQAYTFAASGHRFYVAHPRWCPMRADWVRCDLGFLLDGFPWLGEATLELAHGCGDLHDVEMGFPHAVELGGEAPCSARESGDANIPILPNRATTSAVAERGHPAYINQYLP